MSDALLTAQDREKLAELIRTRSFRSGEFTLASGRTSTRYFDLKATMMHPFGAAAAARGMLDLMRKLDCTHVTGLEMGAVPLIGAMAAMSDVAGSPITTSFVRKAKKGHGAESKIDGFAQGESLDGLSVLAIDDVATSGGSVLQAAQAVRDAGGTVKHAAVLVDRQEGGEALLAEHGIALHCIFTADEIAGAG
ncbi:MAG: orotate phosphoribosyltransferase [Alteripontixanthobacter sp.]